MSRSAQHRCLPLLAALLAAAPLLANAQGTWMQTQCLIGAGTGAGAGAGTVGRCKASPAWGQTGVEHVQALATAAGPGNLGLSLAKPETLPAANAARAQLAAVMLAYLDGDQAVTHYRWFGPVPRPAPPATPVRGSVEISNSLPAPAATANMPASAAPPAAASIQAAWLGGALGDGPQARSASWWLASPYLDTAAAAASDANTNAGADPAADPYRVLRFLAAQCPQLEGKVAPNAWTRCTTRSVPEPASWALAALALLLAAGARRLN